MNAPNLGPGRLFAACYAMRSRSVVAHLPAERRRLSMISAIHDAARQMGVAVVAEGIESREQLDVVRAIGCERAQGFLISRPLPQAQVNALLATEPVW